MRHASTYVMLLATGGLLVAYRIGRTHAAWREVRAARFSVRTGRRMAWSHTVRLIAGIAMVVTGLLMAGFELSR